MHASVQAVAAAVTPDVTLKGSVLLFIEVVATEMRVRADDPKAIREYADELTNRAPQLTAAIVAGTPVADQPAVTGVEMVGFGDEGIVEPPA